MTANNKNSTDNIQKKIGIIMRIGVVLSAMFMIFGFILYLISGSEMQNFTELISLESILYCLKTFDPYTYMMCGIFLLILMPVVRVITTIVLFAKEKDRLYTVITTLVLIILISSFIVGLIIR